MDYVWVVFEIDNETSTERLSSIHDTEEVAQEVAAYYKNLISDKPHIEYITQSWVVVKNLETITNAEVIDVNEIVN